MAMAISVSVTVSIGEERKGVFKTVRLVILLSKLTAFEGKLMWPGSTRKSLYVNPPCCWLSTKAFSARPSG